MSTMSATKLSSSNSVRTKRQSRLDWLGKTHTDHFTKLESNVLIGVAMPQLVILVAITHHGEHQVLENSLEVRANQFPGCSMVHTRERREQDSAPNGYIHDYKIIEYDKGNSKFIVTVQDFKVVNAYQT